MTQAPMTDADGTPTGDLFGMMFGAEHARYQADGSPIAEKLFIDCLERAEWVKAYGDDRYQRALSDAVGWANRVE